jgi:hypothetical protein
VSRLPLTATGGCQLATFYTPVTLTAALQDRHHPHVSERKLRLSNASPAPSGNAFTVSDTRQGVCWQGPHNALRNCDLTEQCC